jgi:two-component system NtrC family sensor kinase
MSSQRERVLIVESDPQICDLIGRQTLRPLGYRVQVAKAASEAIQEAASFSPDVIITDLYLPGLSGKDLLVALSSQGLNAPVVVITEKGKETDIIQAFRLGASDYLLKPIREAEVVSAVERVIGQVRAGRDREMLSRQLQQINQQLQNRVRELTTIFAIGKAVTSITDQRSLFEKIVEGAVYVSQADSGWLLLRDDKPKSFLLRAMRNLPKSVSSKLNQPWDDGISSLVGLSGEPLSIHGEPLKRFQVARYGKSILVVPIKIKKEVIGLLVVVRKDPKPFVTSTQKLLEAVADYASISIVNARLFRELEERIRILQETTEKSQSRQRAVDKTIKGEILPTVKRTTDLIYSLLIGEDSRLNATQKSLLRSSHERLQNVAGKLEALNHINNKK